MKKFLTFAFALIICFCPFLFTACNSNSTLLDLNVYLKSETGKTPEVTYKVYNGSSDGVTEKLSTFTDNKFDNLAQYTEIAFKGAPEWLYKMTIEKITFDVYANASESIQLNVSFSSLKNTSRHNGQFTVIVETQKNKAVPVTVKIDDYVETNSSAVNINIAIDNYMIYFADGENTGLKIDISNFKMYGIHDLAKI